MTLDSKDKSDESLLEPNSDAESGGSPPLVDINALRGEDQTDTCLRPLGLCELGGACDACWYGPNNPRNKKKSDK